MFFLIPYCLNSVVNDYMDFGLETLSQCVIIILRGDLPYQLYGLAHQMYLPLRGHGRRSSTELAGAGQRGRCRVVNLCGSPSGSPNSTDLPAVPVMHRPPSWLILPLAPPRLEDATLWKLGHRPVASRRASVPSWTPCGTVGSRLLPDRAWWRWSLDFLAPHGW